jgi:hypothetical protein
MSTPLDTLEEQLKGLRPTRLPSPARQSILNEMQRPTTGHGWSFWQFAHHTSFQVALAGALSLALLVGWPWLSRSLQPISHNSPETIMASNGLLPSLAFWETELAAASPVNTVAVLRSPSILTNIQIRR